MTFVQAEFYTPTTGRTIDLVVVHSMEYPERLTAAEDCAAYFAHPRLPDGRPNRASAHYCVDADSDVQCVRVHDIAYAAPRINHNGVHIEHAGYASQDRAAWLDGFGTAMLNRSAVIAADLCQEFDIPVEWVDEAGLRAGKRGITDHATSTRAFNIYGGHTDPGAGFPRDVYLDLINTIITNREDWFAMATKEELRAVVREELAASPTLNEVFRQVVGRGYVRGMELPRALRDAIGGDGKGSLWARLGEVLSR